MTSANTVRDNIDAARAAVALGKISVDEATSSLREGTDKSWHFDAFDYRGVMHMCPWHTCANTKHNWA